MALWQLKIKANNTGQWYLAKKIYLAINMVERWISGVKNTCKNNKMFTYRHCKIHFRLKYRYQALIKCIILV